LQQEHALKVQWIAFPLHPETPEQGQTLEELFAGRSIDIPQMLTRLKRAADDLGLPFGRRAMTFNSRNAQETGKWAEAQGRGDAFHRRVFRAYFADGLNIARMEVLADLAADVGLDGTAVASVLKQGRYAAAVDQDWQLSRRVGVTAVPTFVFNAQALVGAQPYDSLKRLVAGDGVPIGPLQ
jgi:predicted DsbA family dithiol-disulfide isomerase